MTTSPQRRRRRRRLQIFTAAGADGYHRSISRHHTRLSLSKKKILREIGNIFLSADFSRNAAAAHLFLPQVFFIFPFFPGNRDRFVSFFPSRLLLFFSSPASIESGWPQQVSLLTLLPLFPTQFDKCLALIKSAYRGGCDLRRRVGFHLEHCALCCRLTNPFGN